MLLTTIKTEDKFEALWERIKVFGGVLQTEHQLLTNKEIYDVLTFIVRPKSKLEMDKWLGQSVWDSVSYAKFRNNRSYIQTYIDYYIHAWTHYRERFELLVEILYHEDTREFFPTYIKKKGGSNGLLDYFMNGTPDVQFSRLVSDRYIQTEKWEKEKDFNKCLDMYFKALKKLRDNNKLVEDTVSIFKTEKRSVFTPPADMEISRSKVPVNMKRTSRVHGITAGSNSSGENLMFPDEEGLPEWDLLVDSAPDDEAETSQGHHDEVTADEGGEISEDSLDPDNQRIESTEPERDDSWLAAVQYTPNGRQVCFRFANEGKCERMEKTGSCKYSHDPEDVKRFKAARVLGPEGIENIAKTLRGQGQFDKTHTDQPPKPSSQGARVSPKRSQGPPGVARRS